MAQDGDILQRIARLIFHLTSQIVLLAACRCAYEKA
jgi:hypothetical protein